MKTVVAKNAPAPAGTQSLPGKPVVLQRKCACGQTTSAGAECSVCQKKKEKPPSESKDRNAHGASHSFSHFGILRPKLAIGTSNDPLEQEADRVAEQLLAAPAHPAVSGAPPHILRFSGQPPGQAHTSPASVDRVLASPGTPLEPALRKDMEQRFGHDFSRVRVHSSAAAQQSARDVNAHAYTVGHNIVFGTGRFAPGTHDGLRLIAHELTHVVQQAEQTSARVAAGETVRVHGRARAGAVQRQDANPLDEKAKKIIEAAKDTSKGIDQRAIDAVNSIVRTYYDPALIEKVVYDEKDPGLTTSPIGTGKDIKGQITVGKYFIENIGTFARRVLQVGHELQHVQQQRSGMGGPAKKNEREFLAFHWEATQSEKAGTGRMSHASRVALIDESLRNYYCMPDADQKTHADKKEELLKLRETEEKASGQAHKEPPTSCGKK
jgi:hypothetical protein